MISQLYLNAAIATKYRGSERLAGVWEFVDRGLWRAARDEHATD